MKDINDKKITLTVAYKLDRITRTVCDLEDLVTLLEIHDCRIECMKDNINRIDSNGRFLIRIITALSQSGIEGTGERSRI